ncbi:hypothetical protein SAMN05216577_1285 [Pseudomonas citronellolis]|uniref:Uncharacterized protein n=1 Tax=Pseudomonas citronellolis TaxID=53408 RepID=A0AAQ1KJ36_9PSED|nr:hypothetical protein CW310_01890 [Pseudomonas citronellolis]SFD51628.1 hypothetical protein SAMN05216577_1285 [Pseudomonas citronellolis]
MGDVFYFKVRTADGVFVEAEQLATFTHYLQAVQFRFVVTRLHGGRPAVTHRVSGKWIADIPQSTLAACRGDYRDAGKLVLIDVIRRQGEERVCQALKRAEQNCV